MFAGTQRRNHDVEEEWKKMRGANKERVESKGEPPRGGPSLVAAIPAPASIAPLWSSAGRHSRTRVAARKLRDLPDRRRFAPDAAGLKRHHGATTAFEIFLSFFPEERKRKT